MTTAIGRALALAVAGVVTLGLIACTTPVTPTADPTVSAPVTPHVSLTPTRTPTPTVAPVVAAALMVASAGITVVSSNGAQLADLPFDSDGAAAVAALGAALGVAPAVSTVEESDCVVASTIYSWDAFTIHTPALAASHRGASFSIEVTGPTTPAGVAVRLADSNTVGASTSTLVGEGARDTWLSENLLLVDPQEGDSWGVVVHTTVDNHIANIFSPRYYNPHNGC